MDSLKRKLARAYLKSLPGRTIGKSSAKTLLSIKKFAKEGGKFPLKPVTKGPLRKPLTPRGRGPASNPLARKVAKSGARRRTRFGKKDAEELVKILKDDRVWFYHNPGCPACVRQIDTIKEAVAPLRINKTSYTKSPDSAAMHGHKLEVTPSWVFGDKFVKGTQSPEQILEHGKAMVKRNASFGYQIGQVKKYGKQFPNGKGFVAKPNWKQQLVAQGWNPVTNAGTLGREFGPGGFNKVFTSKYFYQPRMAYPGGQLSAAVMLNKNCGMAKTPMAKYFDVGMLTDGTATQSFGMRRRLKALGKSVGSGLKKLDKKRLAALTASIGTSAMAGDVVSDMGGNYYLGAVPGAIVGASTPVIAIPTAGGYLMYKYPGKQLGKRMKGNETSSVDRGLAPLAPYAAGLGGAFLTEVGRRRLLKKLATRGRGFGKRKATTTKRKTTTTNRKTPAKKKKTATRRPYNTKKTSTGKTFRGKRSSPSQSAKDFPIGTVRVGGDGKKWEVRAAGKSQRWFHYKGSAFGRANVAMRYARPYVFQPITAKKGDLNWYGAGGGKTLRSKKTVDEFIKNGWIRGARPLKVPF